MCSGDQINLVPVNFLTHRTVDYPAWHLMCWCDDVTPASLVTLFWSFRVYLYVIWFGLVYVTIRNQSWVGFIIIIWWRLQMILLAKLYMFPFFASAFQSKKTSLRVLISLSFLKSFGNAIIHDFLSTHPIPTSERCYGCVRVISGCFLEGPPSLLRNN
jgi:hypothetical protein